MSRSSVRQGQWKGEGAGGRPPSLLTGSACLATESSYRKCLGCWLWLSFEWRGGLYDLLGCQSELGTDQVWLLWEIKAGDCLEMLYLHDLLARCSVPAPWRED